jgi:hypothetical protein
MSQTGDEVVAAAPTTVVRLIGGDLVMRVDRVSEQANAIVAHGLEGGLHEVDNQNVR